MSFVLPPVTALCCTRNRRAWLAHATRCFAEQDYAGQKEMLLLWDGESVADLNGIREGVRAVQAPEGLSFGAKRQHGVRAVRGQVIVHWDDDDWSMPGRITDQVRRLLLQEKQVTGYDALVFRELRDVRVAENGRLRPTSGWWRFKDRHGNAAGASLCYRTSWALLHPFRGGLDADDQFWLEAARAGQAVAADGSAFLCATNHAGCTSGRLIGGIEWEELPGSPYVEEEVKVCP